METSCSLTLTIIPAEIMTLPYHSPTVTLLIPNMHCPSCVETITNLLAPLRSISNLNVSLLLHTVSFAIDPHSPGSSAKKQEKTEDSVAKLLRREGGFIVESPSAETVSTRKFVTSSSGFTAWVSDHLSTAAKKAKAERRKEEERRELHLAHCEACRSGLPHEEARPASIDDLDGQILKTTLSISGMTCASCTQSIGNALRADPAVLDVEINLLSASGVVKHRSSLPSEAVKDAIEDAGFDAEVISSEPDSTSVPKGKERAEEDLRTIISIEGMTCSSCSNAVHGALQGVEGIENVSVDVLGNKATIKHSSALIGQAICDVIEDIGYGATIASSEPVSRKDIPSQSRVKVVVHGIYCQHCITKLNKHLDTLDLSYTPLSTANHTTDIIYTPRSPYTIRDILSGLSNVSPEFEAAVVKETSLSDRSKDIQKREVRVLLVHWIVAFILAIPTFIM